jgi:hypothetical protein
LVKFIVSDVGLNKKKSIKFKAHIPKLGGRKKLYIFDARSKTTRRKA